MKLVASSICWLAVINAENVAITADGTTVDDDCDDSEGFQWGLCLLQTKFLMKSSMVESTPSSEECPGVPVVQNAQLGKCAFEGAGFVVQDGKSIESFFDDNVQMKDFHWFINGMSDTFVDVETHSFPVGTTKATVEGRDLQGNARRCHRTVTIIDTQHPTWQVKSIESELTMFVDDLCQMTATSVFSEYEKLGWIAAGMDNCGVASITKQIRKGGETLYDDSTDASDILSGVGEYEIIYIIEDIHGLRSKHTAVLHLEDNTPPEVIQQCPDDIFVEVGSDTTEGDAEWTLPVVVKDNCLAYGTLPVPLEVNMLGSPMLGSDGTALGGQIKGTFGIGDHDIAYPVYDAHGNVFQFECKFVISVKPEAHPVVIACPADVVTNTYSLAAFGAPVWENPTATQGGNALDLTHITYMNGAAPGLPFPYGHTMVTVKAQGAITGDFTKEAEQSDECTFKVTVKDPFRPFVDGRQLRCAQQAAPLDALKVEPYGVCSGIDLVVSKHSAYEETGDYDLVSSVEKTDLACCADEIGTVMACQEGFSTFFKYCQPRGPAEPAEEVDKDIP